MRRKYSVLWFSQQYKDRLSIRKIILVILFLLPVTFLRSQDADTDSTLIYDAPVVEEPSGNHREYFLHKEIAGALPDSFRLRKLPDTALASLKKDADFWYADSVFRNLQRELQQQQEQARLHPKQGNGSRDGQQNDRVILREHPSVNRVYDRSWFQAILWIIVVGGFLCVVFLYLFNRNVRLFRKANKPILSGEEEIETEDIFAINYQKEIDKASASKNYRLAIRLMFLRLLKNLSERNIIQYKQDRTNFDYLLQLSATKYYHDFFRITRNYEYTWYGKFDVNDEAYRLIREDFEQFDPKVK